MPALELTIIHHQQQRAGHRSFGVRLFPFTDMEELITEMLTALKPTLKSIRKAETALKRYWSDKMALIWTVEHVHQAANENRIVLTDQHAVEILMEAHQHHNRQYGLQWSDIVQMIKNSGLGRDINNRELSRFLHLNILTVDKPDRRKR